MDLKQTYFLDQSHPASQRDPLISFISMAARFGDVDTLRKLLIEALATEPDFMVSPTIGLALKRATQAGHVEVLRCLLAAGADINTKFKGASALHEAVKVNNMQVLEFLLEVKGLCRETFSIAQKTPVMEAACRGRIQCLATMLSAGCSVGTRNVRGLSAIHYCLLPSIGTVDSEDMTACMDLLFNAGADINAQDNFGSTPLHIAVATENMEAILWLLQHNCNLDLESRPPDLAPGIFSCLEGRVALTPVLLALHFSNRRVVQLLVACGCRCYGLSWVLPFCRQYALLHDFLMETLAAPRSLQLCCRIAVRQFLGRDIQNKAKQLKCLPSGFLKYILLTDELL